MTTTTLGLAAAVTHSHWCCNHVDSGAWDQTCLAEEREIGGELHESARLGLELQQYSYREQSSDTTWTAMQPTIQVHAEVDGYEGYVDLTLAEARKAAAALLNLVELAEAQTAGCLR